MTGTLGANAIWDRMPFMAGLKLVRKALMPTGIQYMELKGTWFHIDGGFRSLQALNPGAHGFRCWDV
jgi:hypothetical protein